MVRLDKIYRYDELMECMKTLYEQYSEMADFRIIGISHDGRKIPMIRIGNKERCLICTAGIHGRESVNPTVILKIIETYCVAYQSDQYLDHRFRVKELLDFCGICFIPLMNPDGYMLALEGPQMIRETALRQRFDQIDIPFAEWKFNGRGRDINRNFLSVSYINQPTSPEAMSENETKALVGMFGHQQSIAYLDFHCRGEVIFYYRSAMSEEYNQRSQILASKLSQVTGYRMGSRAEEFGDRYSGGNSVNYYSERWNNPAITIETVPDEAEFPLDVSWVRDTYEAVYLTPLVVIEHYQ